MGVQSIATTNCLGVSCVYVCMCFVSGGGTATDGSSARSSHRSHRRHHLTSSPSSCPSSSAAHLGQVSSSSSSSSTGGTPLTAGRSAVDAAGNSSRCSGSTSPPDPSRRSRSRGSSCSGSFGYRTNQPINQQSINQPINQSFNHEF